MIIQKPVEANNSEFRRIIKFMRITRIAYSPQYIGHEKHNNQLQHIRVRPQRVQYLCDILRR